MKEGTSVFGPQVDEPQLVLLTANPRALAHVQRCSKAAAAILKVRTACLSLARHPGRNTKKWWTKKEDAGAAAKVKATKREKKEAKEKEEKEKETKEEPPKGSKNKGNGKTQEGPATKKPKKK